MYAELENSPIGKKLTAAGFAIMNTGGGIMCWGRETSSESLILIGQGEDGMGESGDETDWFTSVTDRDGQYLENLTVHGTLSYCIAHMAVIDGAIPDDREPCEIAAATLVKDPAALRDLTEDVINAIALTIQTKIGQTDGGVAGAHFSDDDIREQILEIVTAYVQAEAVEP